MNQVFHARKKRQLRYLIKRLKGHLRDGRSSTEQRLEPLIKKIKALLKELSGILAPFHLKKILGPAAVILGMSFGSQVAAQSFAAPQQNPFGLVSASIDDSPTPPVFADMDDDGDLDLLAGTYAEYTPTVIQYFENTGTSTDPQFAAPQGNPFGLTTELGTLLFPIVADLDGDGDFDLLLPAFDLNSYDFLFKYFENTGSPAVPQFSTAIDNPFGLDPITDDLIVPAFVDLDGDGDIDLSSVDYYGNVLYFENTGSATNPQFAAQVQNPFGLGAGDGYFFPTFADLDNDGDMDLLGGDSEANFQYFENTGTSTDPQFGTPVLNPFGLATTLGYAVPTFGDLDDDGDVDLLVSEYFGNFQYFENTTPVGIQEQYVDVPIDLYPNPANDLLTINTDSPFERIEIYDAMGRLLNIYDGSVSSIDVSAFPKGMYLLKFMDEQKQFATRKILKE